jgi:hypothetical protein
MTVSIISRLAYETARHSLKGQTAAPSGSYTEAPAVRLKNLDVNEVEAFLELWDAHSAVDQIEGVQVLIARGGGVNCEERFLADPEKSITWYRNHNDHGLVYIQTKVESDEQGLESMFTIQDRNFLDGSLVTENFDPEKRVSDIAWEQAGGAPGAMPRKMPELLAEVREQLQKNQLPVSVRPYSAFASAVSSTLQQSAGQAIDADFLIASIGSALPTLGLFPDRDWKADSNTARRLVTNYRLSDLMDPNGLDQEPEALVEKLKEVVFKDDLGTVFERPEQDEWREACKDFVLTRSEKARSAVPFSIYRQIFSKAAVTGVPLGDRVREELEGRADERASEFDKLDLTDGLNAREPEAARTLVEVAAVKNSADVPLIDLLTIQTQKLLRRLAYPRDRVFSNPFTLIVEILKSIDPKDLQGGELELRCGRMPDRDGAYAPSLGLFSFLYAQTLREIVEASAVDSGGVRLTVADAQMLKVAAPPLLRELEPGASEVDFDAEVIEPCIWDGLPIELRLFSSAERGRELLEEQTNLRWQPEDIDWLAFGWLMIAAKDAPTDQPLIEFSSADYQGLVTKAVSRTASLSDLVSFTATTSDPQDQSGVISALLEGRLKAFSSMGSDGLGSDIADRYFAEWASLLSQARQQFVPNGILDARLQLLLGLDVLHSPSESKALMLLSHPLKLRWFGTYLLEVSKVCINALALQLRLNSANDEYYLGRLEQLSPHGQPPLLANSARTLLIPVAEHGMAEIYAAIKREGQVTSLWKSELDDAAIAEIARQVEQYLRAHPHKSDGVSLVFVLPAGGAVPQKLLAMVRKGVWKNLPVRCHVLAPRNCWDEMVRSFQKLETESRMSGQERHGPPLQLELEEWAGELKAAENLAKLYFDIAIVPNFFGDKVDVNEYADAPEQRAGSFNPLYDNASYVDRDAAAGSVSIVLKPDASDPALEDWSTTNVRLLRSEAISPQSPECTDYVKLRIRFEEAGALFAALHDCSHWVVTLDRYIGRDQIESLPKRPDVLTVREGVGQSGLSTLVVSSDAGKKFVVQRLARKLERIAQSDSAGNSRQLAEQVYDEIRNVSPGLILKAMGLSRVTEEVLGLMVAKRIAERHHPVEGARSIWISLDEHSEWFGGDGGVRADLCRVDLFRKEGRLQVGVLAVEGKLRKAYDAHGEQQASITAQLLREALEPESEAVVPAVDSAFWRRAILTAICGAGGRTASPAPSIESYEDEEDDFREDLRSGEFDLAYCKALYSICLYDRQAQLASEGKDGVTIYRSSEREILSLIKEGQPATSAPTPNAGETVGTTDIAETLGNDAPGTKTGPGLPGKAPSDEIDNPVSEVLSGMSETEKLQMYQLILDTLSEFGVQVRSPDDGKPPYIEGPAFIQFRVRPDRGVRPNKISEQESSLRLNLGLDEGKLLRFSIGGGTMNIDVPKSDEERYYVTAGDLWNRWSNASSESLRVPIGINQRGEVVDLDFSSPNSPHLLIGGATGSGKSEALNTILHGLTRFYAPDQLRLVLIDPKQTELLAFEKSPHLLGQIGFFDDDAVASLDQAVAEMQRRYGIFRARHARSLPEYNKLVEAGDRLPWQVIVLDEYADLVSEPDVRRVIEASVKRLSQKARACGIHLIIATQKPSAENISTTVRSNLPAQLALRCRGAAESRIVMDDAGAETLNGKGDAFFKIADRLERVQCALVT